MLGGLLDDPELIAGAARDAGLDPAGCCEWCAREDVEAALQADIAAARDPLPAARALDHKLGGPRGRVATRRRATSSRRRGRAAAVAVPGFNPVEVYETAIANLAPELGAGRKPAFVEELLAWAGEPLATAEVVGHAARPGRSRAALSRVARAEAAGADFDLHWLRSWVVHQAARALTDVRRDGGEDGVEIACTRLVVEIPGRCDLAERVIRGECRWTVCALPRGCRPGMVAVEARRN